MDSHLRIAVADDDPRIRRFYSEILPRLGHVLTCLVDNGRDLVRQCEASPPDLVITDIRMPGGDGIEAVHELCSCRAVPVILVSAYHEPELLERAKYEHILVYLLKPVKQADLKTAISIAMERFGQFQALRDEAGRLRQELEDRKLIERAKGIIMKKAGLDEPTAFSRLRKLARENNEKMIEVARMVIRAEEAFETASVR
ncbi:MAG: response regulator [Isosphaeraceae bacterium]